VKNEHAIPQENIPSKDRRDWQRAARVLLWLAFGALLYLIIQDFYTGAVILPGNTASLRSKRFVIFLVGMLFLIAGYGYGLWLSWTGGRPVRLHSILQSVRARLPFTVRVLLSLVILALPA
jgi:hypothetical protein